MSDLSGIRKKAEEVLQTNGTIKLINNRNRKAYLYEVRCDSEPCLIKNLQSQ